MLLSFRYVQIDLIVKVEAKSPKKIRDLLQFLFPAEGGEYKDMIPKV